MKILLSADHCQPNIGSEWRRGWMWATTLAASGHEVWVITRQGYRRAIEDAMAAHPIPQFAVSLLSRVLAVTRHVVVGQRTSGLPDLDLCRRVVGTQRLLGCL